MTRAADYAVRVMIHLAGLPPETRLSRSELSTAAECPEQFLCKVLQTLARAGLVISHRGNTGGFELHECRRNASLLDIVEAIEGPLHLNVCLNQGHGCNRHTWCPAHNVWCEAQEALQKVLRATTILDLARRVKTVPPVYVTLPRPLGPTPAWPSTPTTTP